MNTEEKELNSYMKVQIMNEIMEVDNFLKLLRLAAKKDDDIIDSYEEKIIKKIEKSSKKYIESLRSFV